MLFKRISRTSPEKMFVVAKNSYSTASLSNGQVVQWDYATDADGVGVTVPAAASGVAVAGVVTQTIAHGDYGLVQVYGYHSSVRVRTATGGSPAVAAGSPLVMQAAVFAFEGMSTASNVVLKSAAGFALAAQASFTTKAIAAFIKSL